MVCLYLFRVVFLCLFVCFDQFQEFNNNLLHIIGDKLINPIVGVYIPIIRIPIKGGMTIPNTRSLDPGSCMFLFFCFLFDCCLRIKDKEGEQAAERLGWRSVAMYFFRFLTWPFEVENTAV